VRAYVEQILAPSLSAGQSVVEDNLGAHQGARVRQLIEEKGCELFFLPAYSPDYSPIEETCSKLKALLRRVGARTHEALQETIGKPLETVTAHDALGWFTHCGYQPADFRRQQVGFVFQLYYLLPSLTALENVMAPLLPYRRKRAFDLRQRAQELLENVGLGDRLGHPTARLSGGEQQRVAIARALINRPKLVLADEPTGNLDPATGHEVLEVLRELQRTGNPTLLMVTHDPELAALADRRLHLEQLQCAEV
jgi:ABC-type glutathione transport system ATPase component